jgi:uncharacterized membrane protein YdbT with pleckstrin-like domain
MVDPPQGVTPMSDILYQANPSVWRTHPFGTILCIVLIVLGGYVAVTAKLPYLSALLAQQQIAIPEAFDIRWVGYGLMVIGVLPLLRWWLQSLFDHLEIRPNEIIWTHGLLNKNYTETNMASVRTVRVQQSFFQRLVGAGDLVIYTTGDQPELAISGLPRPNEIREHIKRHSTREV